MSFTLGKPDHGRPQTGFTVDEKGQKVYRMPTGPKTWADIQIPPPKTVNGKTMIHVDMFLRSKECPLWERGGKVKFAQLKGKEFATESEFVELFRAY